MLRVIDIQLYVVQYVEMRQRSSRASSKTPPVELTNYSVLRALCKASFEHFGSVWACSVGWPFMVKGEGEAES